MPNYNPETGIRYGVISCNSLDPDLVNDLMFGPDAKDLWYEEAYAEAKKEAENDWDELNADAHIAAAETDYNMTQADREDFIERWFESHHHRSDRDDFVDGALEQFSSCYSSDENPIEGEYEGVKYHISYLGGAPLLWVFQGPVGRARQLCSPCVPNAADLDGGFLHPDEEPPEDDTNIYECYVVPRDWLAKETSDR